MKMMLGEVEESGLGRNTSYLNRIKRVEAATLKQKQAANHVAYLTATDKFVASSKVEAQSMLNLAAAIAGGDQNKINLAVQASLIAENNAMNDGVAAAIAASNDVIFQAQYTAQVVKASLLPGNGFWNDVGQYDQQYSIGQGAFDAMKAGKIVYNYFPGNSFMVARGIKCYCNNFYSANPKATLADINAYGAKLRQAAQSSDSFGSFLMGALPYIALTAAIGAAIVFTAGAAAPVVATIAPAAPAAGGIFSTITGALPSTTAIEASAVAAVKTGATKLITSVLTPNAPTTPPTLSPTPAPVEPVVPAAKSNLMPLLLGVASVLTFLR